jgi:hypothetical protein
MKPWDRIRRAVFSCVSVVLGLPVLFLGGRLNENTTVPKIQAEQARDGCPVAALHSKSKYSMGAVRI